MITFRKMTAADAPTVIDMMRTFYASPALITHGSEEIFRNNVRACLAEGPYASGWMLESDGEAAGYAMLAHSYSTEFGRECVWVEDLYLLPAFRGQGAGSAFLQMVRRAYPGAVIRLEVERGNDQALAVYRKNGMEELPYREMIGR